MGYDLSAWLSARLARKSKGRGTYGQMNVTPGVSGYMTPKVNVTEALDEVFEEPEVQYQRRGDTEDEAEVYDTYAEDREMDEEEEVIHLYDEPMAE